MIALWTALVLIQDDAPRRIVGEAQLGGRAYETLELLCDRVGGRLSGHESGRAAEEFAFERLRDSGLAPAFEPFAHPGWRNRSIHVTVDGREIYALSLANTLSAEVDAEVFDVGYGLPEEFEAAGGAVRGKWALVRHGAPEGKTPTHRVEKMTLSRQYGAAGMILVHSGEGNLAQAGVCSIGEPAPIPGISIPLEEGGRIARLKASGQTVRVRAVVENELGEVTARNVVAEIRGSDLPDEVVVIGAHLDSWATGQGAMDNGTGTCVVLETARVFAALGLRPGRTVRFVLYMGEELGMWGSKAYVRGHEGELDRFVAVLNLDMVGAATGYQLYACDEAIPFFERLAERYEALGLSASVGSKAELHSDHQPFMLAGVPAFGLATKLPDSAGSTYHTAGDTFERVAQADLASCATVAAITVWELAQADARPCPRLSPAQVRERMERDGVKDALVREGQWPFE